MSMNPSFYEVLTEEMDDRDDLLDLRVYCTKIKGYGRFAQNMEIIWMFGAISLIIMLRVISTKR